MENYRKLIAAIVTSVIAILATQNIEVDPVISGAAVTIIGAVAVWFFPNDAD